MGYVEGQNRTQAVIVALDEMVFSISIARIIDRFIEVVHLKRMGLTNTVPEQNGRLRYSPFPMAKLWLLKRNTPEYRGHVAGERPYT